MWQKFKESKYNLLVKYYFLGLFLAALVFQFATSILEFHSLQADVIFNTDFFGMLLAIFVGGFVGGVVWVLMKINSKDLHARDIATWEKIKDKRNSAIILKFIFAFSVGGFAGMLSSNLLDGGNGTALFSETNIYSYIGMILAASTFAIFISHGIVKRLAVLFQDKS